MKKTLNAIEMMLPEGVQKIAFAESGNLRAIAWKSNVGCHFWILREDPETGDIDTALQPSDAEDLATLTAVIASIFHQVGNPDNDATHDLGCLAHCLGQTLGIEFDDAGMPKQMMVQ